jgi:hypothetical protein
MSYPPAPWRLQGDCLLAVHLIETARARPFVPPELAIVPVLPGRTLAAAFLVRYGPGSVIEYGELAVIAALVRWESSRGFWISHIYVDDPASLEGGRELWGLPKELAEFTWEGDARRRVQVRQGGRPLFAADAGRPLRLWRQRMTLPFLSYKQPDLLRFRARVSAGIGLSGGALRVPAESPFAGLGLGRPWMVLHGRAVRFEYTAPQTIGRL